MGVLVDDLLLLARLDEGRPLERRRLNMTTLVGELVGDARVVEPDRPIELVTEGPVEVEGDDVRLRQVVGNLLSNARSHTPRGAPVTVRVLAREGEAVIEVADSGPGHGSGARRSGSSSASSAPTPRARAPAAAAAWACRSSRPSPRPTAGAPRSNRPPGGGPPSASSCPSQPTHRRVPRPPEVGSPILSACQPPPLRSPPPGTRPRRPRRRLPSGRPAARSRCPTRPATRSWTSSSPSTTRRPTSSGACAACTPSSRARSRSPRASPSPTTRAPTAPGTSPGGCAPSSHGVEAVRLEAKGRGRALRAVWEASDAAVLAYMDVDLSTDLAGLLPLVAPLVSGHSDLAIGSRRARGSRVVRGPKREFISRVLQPAAPRDPAHPLQRRPVRLQGDPGRRGARGAAAHAGRRLVLRHRDAGHRRARRHADPRGPGGLGRRPRQPGGHRRDGPGRPARHRPRAARPVAGHASARASRCCAGAAGGPTAWCARRSASRAIGVAQHPRLRRHLPAAARRRRRRPGGQRRRAGGDGRGQHLRQPPGDVRRPRRGGLGAPPAPGLRRLRGRPGADQRLARGAATWSRPRLRARSRWPS